MRLHLRKTLVACTLLAAAATALQAQTPPAPATAASGPQAHARHHDPARMAERMNKRLAELKDKLQITAQQEAAWTSFTTAMQPRMDRQRADRQALAGMTTPDRLDHMRALRERRNAEMDRRADATKAFYEQLNAEQKKTFDAETARMFTRGHGHKGKHHRHHG